VGGPSLILQIRQSARLVSDLPLDLQRAARDSYAVSLRTVFTLAACSTLFAFIVRLPIPDRNLVGQHRKKTYIDNSQRILRNSVVDPSFISGNVGGPGLDSTSPLLSSDNQRFCESPGLVSELDLPLSDCESGQDDVVATSVRPSLRYRQISMFESVDGIVDMEADYIDDGSARQQHTR